MKTHGIHDGRRINHNETLVRSGLKGQHNEALVRSHIVSNHNETLVRSYIVNNHNETLVQNAQMDELRDLDVPEKDATEVRAGAANRLQRLPRGFGESRDSAHKGEIEPLDW